MTWWEIAIILAWTTWLMMFQHYHGYITGLRKGAETVLRCLCLSETESDEIIDRAYSVKSWWRTLWPKGWLRALFGKVKG